MHESSEVISKSSWLTVCVEDKEKTADLFVSVPCLWLVYRCAGIDLFCAIVSRTCSSKRASGHNASPWTTTVCRSVVHESVTEAFTRLLSFTFSLGVVKADLVHRLTHWW